MNYLEVARGHDGMLRGMPEPAVIVAVYACIGPQVMVIGRTLHRFEPKGPFPCSAVSGVVSLPEGAVTTMAPVHYVILAVALEEDGKEDTQRLFGALEHHRRLALWAVDHQEIEPRSIAAVGGPAFPTPQTVELFFDNLPIPASCKSDKWVGAVAWSVPSQGVLSESLYRLPFLSPDGRNDWTAVVSITH
jgi:hypothetical protein